MNPANVPEFINHPMGSKLKLRRTMKIENNPNIVRYAPNQAISAKGIDTAVYHLDCNHYKHNTS
jgi:hypothetical protein